MHYCVLELKSGLLCALPLLAAIEVAIAILIFLTDWVPLKVKICIMTIYFLGALSTTSCWFGIVCQSHRLLYFWLGYQILIISACYLFGFYILMSGAVALDIKASEENYESLRMLVLGSLIYVVGPLELYTWKRIKYYRNLVLACSRTTKKSLEQVNNLECEQFTAIRTDAFADSETF